MSTYAQVQQQIKDLQKQAEQLKKQELTGIITQIRSQIAEFGLTEKDLFPPSRGRKPKADKPLKTVMYRTPQGEEWSGQTKGRPPRWIANIKESRPEDWQQYLEQFRV